MGGTYDYKYIESADQKPGFIVKKIKSEKRTGSVSGGREKDAGRSAKRMDPQNLFVRVFCV